MVQQLLAQTRIVKGKKVSELRDSGIIPGIVYGPGKTPHMISLNKSVLQKAYEQFGSNTILQLSVDEGKSSYDVLIYDVDMDPMTRFIRHVDFYSFKEGEKLHTEIPLKFIGDAKPVKEKGAVLVKQFEELTVKCLPKDLVAFLEVDLNKIQTLEDFIKIKDIILPSGIEVDHNLDEIVASTMLPEEEKEVEPVVTTDMPEVEKKGKKDEEGDAEGNADKK